MNTDKPSRPNSSFGPPEHLASGRKGGYKLMYGQLEATAKAA